MKKLISAVLISMLWVTTVFGQNYNVSRFPDVNSGTDYHKAIEWMASKNFIQGYPDGNFYPNRCVNRAEALKMFIISNDVQSGVTTLNEVLPYSPFPDVNISDWYWQYVDTALVNDFVQGYPDGFFRPERCVNRVEAMKLASLFYFGEDELLTSSAPLYIDDKLISDMSSTDWYAKYARTLFSARAVGTTHTMFESSPSAMVRSINFYPADSMTRKEVAELIFRLTAMRDNKLETYTEFYSPIY